MSFLTCFCDLPQKLHLTRSPPSPNFATLDPLPRTRSLRCADRFGGAYGVPGGDDLVDQAVGHRLVGGDDEVAVRVTGDLVDRLAGVLGEHRVEEIAHPDDLLRLQLDVAGLPGRATPRLVQEDARV